MTTKTELLMNIKRVMTKFNLTESALPFVLLDIEKTFDKIKGEIKLEILNQLSKTIKNGGEK